MKECPQCKNTYTDDALSFCMADGTTLVFLNEDATVVRPAGEMRINIEQEKSKPQATVAPPVKKSGGIWKLMLGFLAAIIALSVVVAAAAGIYLYSLSSGISKSQNETSNKNNSNSNVISTKVSPTPVVSPTVDEEKKKLQDELANLQKKVDEAKATNNATSDETASDDGERTMIVNSPGDGFLAMRSEPDSDAGERIAKIPHGTKIRIIECLKKTTVSGKSGHWCETLYDGTTGWVFDAWLK